MNDILLDSTDLDILRLLRTSCACCRRTPA